MILALIRELAEYEKLSHQVVATEESLRSALFSASPHAEALLGEIDGVPCGFALFFHNFSTFLGLPGLYLEDIYVRRSQRGMGLGKALLRETARIAQERGCGRMEWSVLDWNAPAIQFYEKLGATVMREWLLTRLDRDGIRKLAE